MSADEIFDVVKRDKMFYEASGGGVTVSGGEALLQPQPVSDLLEKCRRAGIHICIETSGCAAEYALKQVLPNTDLVLYDLKHLNSYKHSQYTGKPNGLILSNARIVAGSGIETLFRMPLVPGINDDMQNIKDTADFLHVLGEKYCRIELMPYHRLGIGKYESLDRPYHLTNIIAPDPEHVEKIKKAFEDKSIMCTVSR